MDKNDFRREIKQDLKVMKRNKVISALAFVVLGVVLLAWPTATLYAVSKAVGLVLAVGGIAAVVMYFVNGSRGLYSYAGLAGGVIVAVIGIWLFFNPSFLINLIPTIVGLILIISGLVNLSEAFTIRKQHGESVLVTIILAIITIVFGLAILLLQTQFAALMTRLMGIALVYDGVSDLLFISRLSSAARSVEIAAQQIVHDAQAVDVTDTVQDVTEPARDTESETPAEEPVAEETPVEEETPTEEPATEETPVEEPETPGEEPAAEETPADEPAEETPTEENPLVAEPDEFVNEEEETPTETEETPTEETPAAE